MTCITQLKARRVAAVRVWFSFICVFTTTSILWFSIPANAAPAQFCNITVSFNIQTASGEQNGFDGTPTSGPCEGTFSVPGMQVAVNEGSFGVFGRTTTTTPSTNFGSDANVQVGFGPFTIIPTGGATATTVSVSPNFIVDGSMMADSLDVLEELPSGFTENPNTGHALSDGRFRLFYNSSGPAGNFSGPLGGGDIRIHSTSANNLSNGTGFKQVGVFNEQGVGTISVGPTGVTSATINWAPGLPIELPVGQDIFFSLSFIGGVQASVSTCDPTLAIPCRSEALLDMGRTFAFPSGEPVFDLPEGFTVSGLGGQVVDNIWLGQSVSLIPIPAAFWLFGSGLIGLIGIARQKKL